MLSVERVFEILLKRVKNYPVALASKLRSTLIRSLTRVYTTSQRSLRPSLVKVVLLMFRAAFCFRATHASSCTVLYQAHVKNFGIPRVLAVSEFSQASSVGFLSMIIENLSKRASRHESEFRESVLIAVKNNLEFLKTFLTKIVGISEIFMFLIYL